jgi:predicted transcriptional regulator
MAGGRSSELELRGDLQAEIMEVVWRLGEATVDDVRGEQPVARRPAYNTVQTVMNRLIERGLLKRKRSGRAYVYRPAYAEPEFLARAMRQRLARTSRETRQAALLNLIEGLDGEDLAELARYTSRVRRARGGS